MSLRVTVEDLETGDKGERIVPDGDYILITSEPCYLDGMQVYAKTHVLTVKGLTRGAVVLPSSVTTDQQQRVEGDAPPIDALSAPERAVQPQNAADRCQEPCAADSEAL